MPASIISSVRGPAPRRLGTNPFDGNFFHFLYGSPSGQSRRVEPCLVGEAAPAVVNTNRHVLKRAQ